MSTVATKIRIAAAASAIAAAAALTPAAVAHASPAAPLPEASLGSLLGGNAVTPCDPADLVCLAAASDSSPAFAFPPFFWLGSPANPNFRALFGIHFPAVGNFEACFLGAAIHVSPYTGGFIGLGLGC
jgi:hypothetical protein